MSRPTVCTLFAGGGGKSIGAVAAGFEAVGAVEYDAAIAAVYAANVSPLVTVSKVEEADPRPYAGVDLLLASPVCTRASIANANGGESEVDLAAAEGVCRWLRACRPRLFVMENVTQYRAFRSCKLIERCLNEMGYFFTADHVQAADYAVPQTRRRLIIRAVQGGLVPPLPSPVPWVGWYAAIEDLIPGLPESRFADWQLQRLPELWDDSGLCPGTERREEGDKFLRPSRHPAATVKATEHKGFGKAFLHMTSNTQKTMPTGTGVLPCSRPANTVTQGSLSARAFLMDGCNASGRAGAPTCGTSERPSYTITAAQKGVHRAWLEEGRVVAMTPRALARFQSFPDTYALPDSRKLASTIIGNAMPVRMAEALISGLKEAQ